MEIEIMKWLDNIISAMEELDSLAEFNTSIASYHTKDDHIVLDKGIDIVSDALNIPLEYSYYPEIDYPHIYMMHYMGRVISQCGKEKLNVQTGGKQDAD